MKTFARIAAALAVVLVILSLCSLLFTTVFQVGIASELMDELFTKQLKKHPVIPLGSFLSCLMMLCCMAPMIFLAGRKKGGIWIEIALLLVMLCSIPILSTMGDFVYWYIIRGEGYTAEEIPRAFYRWFNVSGNIPQVRFLIYELESKCMRAAEFGQILMYITCGVSIGLRLRDRKNKKRAAEIPSAAEVAK